MKVFVRWSKTNQDRSRVVTVPLPAVPGSPLCPVHAFTMLDSLCPCGSSASFVNDFRSLLGKAGFNPSLFSGHSFRRGGATTAFKANIPSEFIQRQGDWRSDCYKRYIDISFDQKLKLCFLLRDYILRTSWACPCLILFWPPGILGGDLRLGVLFSDHQVADHSSRTQLRINLFSSFVISFLSSQLVVFLPGSAG